MAKTFYLATAGTMGSGKTTVANLIAKHLGFHLLLEQFGENQFLPRFYKNMPRWAFHSQTFYLMEKITQMLETNKLLKKTSIVQDTVIYQDVMSYAKAQFILGNMDEAEFALYTKIYASFVERLPKPDLIIYLKAPLEILLARVKQRPQSVEKNQKIAYLKTLDMLNQEWIKRQPREKMLFIDAFKYNFVVDDKHIVYLIDKIKEKLKTFK